MATVYLAFSTAGIATLKHHAEDKAVNMLVAYPLLDIFMKERKHFNIEKWVLDSGAFSVFNSGKTISVYEYINACRGLDAAEVIALDDLESWGKSKRNAQIMWAAGINAMPVYHQGEPLEYLDWCCENSDKVGLGSKIKTKPKWLKAVFAHVWKKHGPKKLHGFGMAGLRAVETAPFDSVDASSAFTSVGRFGQFAGFTGHQIHLRTRMKKGGFFDVWVEIVEHMRRQTWSEARWKGELTKLVDRTEDLYSGAYKEK